MKKLESLENFRENKLSETHQSNVFGGIGPTGGGEVDMSDGDTGAGCYSYTSDVTYRGVNNEIKTEYTGTIAEVNIVDPNGTNITEAMAMSIQL